jgi:hypothetical protein
VFDDNGNKIRWIRNRWNPDELSWKFYSKQHAYWSPKKFESVVTSTTAEIESENLSRESVHKELLVYPNPILDYATVQIPESIKPKQVDIINLYGKTVKILHNINSNIISFQREDLPGGIYFIRIRARETYLRKVIIL